MPNEQTQLFGGAWTEDKLKILSQYLSKYNTALKNTPFTRVYVDAFAGTGYRQQRKSEFALPDIFEEIAEEEPQSFLKGSAKHALEAQPPFHRYIFVESDPAKIVELNRLREEHYDKASVMQIEQREANGFIQEFCAHENWRAVRAVVFLDPFATQVQWDTVAAIAATKAIDVWILFPLMAVNRLLANDPAKACRAPLDRIFGTSEWFERFYRTHIQDDIFGQSLEVVRKACNFDGIGAFYQERLKNIFACVAPEPRIFYNSRQTPLFQLFFAAGNPKGAPIAVRIAKHLLEKL